MGLFPAVFHRNRIVLFVVASQSAVTIRTPFTGDMNKNKANTKSYKPLKDIKIGMLYSTIPKSIPLEVFNNVFQKKKLEQYHFEFEFTKQCCHPVLST